MDRPKILGLPLFSMEKVTKRSDERPRFAKTKLDPPKYNPFKILAMLYMIMFSRGMVKSMPKSFAKKKAREAKQKLSLDNI